MSDEITGSEDGSWPACLISLRNPAGMMLVLRGHDVPDMIDQVNELWDGHIQGHKAKRAELTNLILQSFNPAVIADMQEGRSAEQAMGYEPDELTTAAYEAMAQGARRAPAPAAAANGARSGGGGAGKFTVDQVGEANLPDYFLDKLTRRNTCPDCDGDEFWDNRKSKQSPNAPDFKCANRDCPGGKGKGMAVWPPDEERPRSGSRTR